MVFEGFDLRLRVTTPISVALPRIHDSLVQIWPNVCGWVEREGSLPDIDLVAGVFPTSGSTDECYGAHFSRDPDMLNQWDWGRVESESFEGEGPVSVLGGVTSEEGGNAIVITLPNDPEIDQFSKELLRIIINHFPEWILDMD